MKIQRLATTLMVLLPVMSSPEVYSQSGTQTNGSQVNNIVTGAPFLLITPDARAGGMGEAGVAVLPDGNSMSINPSKLPFLHKPYGFSFSYSPWLKSLVPDINLAFLSGYYQLDGRSTLASSMRFFSLGEIQYFDINQQDMGVYNPYELAFDATYARRFGESFSLGTSLRYIYSNLASGQISGGNQKRPESAVAVDVSAYFKEPTVWLGSDAIISGGIHIANIGTKMRNSDSAVKMFLPANLKVGGASTFLIDDFNQFTIALDVNKLLVPTQPIYDNGKIIAGRNPDRSVPAGIFGSFNDAPGGFREELKEISIATGVEYWYNQKFAFRTGYFFENPQKGDRRYLTLGAGLKYNAFHMDFAYIIANVQKSPLANTLRFTLLFNFGEAK